MHSPINIFSGEKGLGGALTFPTEMSYSKGSISNKYPVVFEGVQYPDAESCYHSLKGKYSNSELLYVNIAATRFNQYPSVCREIERRGGVSWLMTCSHVTGATSDRYKAWEGDGMSSKFIRLLADGYSLYLKGIEFSKAPQGSLFD